LALIFRPHEQLNAIAIAVTPAGIHMAGSKTLRACWHAKKRPESDVYATKTIKSAFPVQILNPRVGSAGVT
jgi:hypothetical protein